MLKGITGRLTAGIDVQDGTTPLHFAARDGYAVIVQALLQGGADVTNADGVRRIVPFNI